MKKLLRWLNDHTPVFCFICKKMFFEKDATYKRTLTGQSVPLCNDCHGKWFGDE